MPKKNKDHKRQGKFSKKKQKQNVQYQMYQLSNGKKLPIKNYGYKGICYQCKQKKDPTGEIDPLWLYINGKWYHDNCCQ